MTRPVPAHLSDLGEDDDDGSMYLVTGDEPDAAVLEVVPEKPTIAKAIMAFVSAAAATLLTALSENGITATEWIVVASTSILAALAVYSTSNKRA